MIHKLVGSLLIILFLATVLGKTGLSFIEQSGTDNLTQLFESAENSSRESEKNETENLKEYWIACDLRTWLKPGPLISKEETFVYSFSTPSFHPSVPTPPPNCMINYLVNNI